MKRMIKMIATVVAIATILMAAMSSNVLGANTSTPKPAGSSASGSKSTVTSNVSMDYGTMKNQADSFITKGTGNAALTQAEVISTLVPVGRIIVGIASIVLVVVGTILGLKYMMAGANEKANLKEKLIWYVISIVLVFGAAGIYAVVSNVVEGILA